MFYEGKVNIRQGKKLAGGTFTAYASALLSIESCPQLLSISALVQDSLLLLSIPPDTPFAAQRCLPSLTTLSTLPATNEVLKCPACYDESHADLLIVHTVFTAKVTLTCHTTRFSRRCQWEPSQKTARKSLFPSLPRQPVGSDQHSLL